MSLVEVDHPTRWKKGQSGNPSGLPGKPVGARTAFSQGFLKDLAQVWQEHGRDTMLHTAKTQPATFFAVCARLIGPEVKVTVERSLPGNYRHPIGPTCVSFYRPSSKPCLML